MAVSGQALAPHLDRSFVGSGTIAGDGLRPMNRIASIFINLSGSTDKVTAKLAIVELLAPQVRIFRPESGVQPALPVAALLLA